MSYSASQLQAYGLSQAAQYGVPSSVFNAVIMAESGGYGDPYQVNSVSGATGLGQFLPSTAANPGYGIAPFNPSDPQANLSGTAQYLAALKQKTGSWLQAIGLYSGTPAGQTPYAGNQNGPAAVNAATQADQGTYQCPSWLPSWLCDQSAGQNPSTLQPGAGVDPMTGLGPVAPNNGVAGIASVVGDLVSRAGIIVLGVVVIAIGTYMLRDRG